MLIEGEINMPTVSGLVYDMVTGAPIWNATVVVRPAGVPGTAGGWTPRFALTNDDGEFEIQDVPPGRYTLVTTQRFYKTQKQQIDVGYSDLRIEIALWN